MLASPLAKKKERGHEAPMDLDRNSQTQWGNSSPSVSDTIRPNELKLSTPPSPSAPLFVGGENRNFINDTSSILSSPKGIPLSSKYRSTTLRKNRHTPPKKSKRPFKVENNTSNSSSLKHSLPLPSLIMGYAQVLFNSVIISFLLYFSIQFALTIKGDVQTKVSMEINRINAEISNCQRQYQENRCHPDHRVPAMESACVAWQTCIDGGPNSVGSLSTAKLAAETFADIINGLIEPISYKTLFFILSSLFGTIFLSNYALNMAKSRINYNIHHESSQSLPPKRSSRSSSLPHSYTLQLTPNHHPNFHSYHPSTPLRIETRGASGNSSDSESIN